MGTVGKVLKHLVYAMGLRYFLEIAVDLNRHLTK